MMSGLRLSNASGVPILCVRGKVGSACSRASWGANACGSRLTILYGPTGAGKSSVLQAGVLPQLGRTPATVVVYFDRWNTPSFVQQLKDLLIELVEEEDDGAPVVLRRGLQHIFKGAGA